MGCDTTPHLYVCLPGLFMSCRERLHVLLLWRGASHVHGEEAARLWRKGEACEAQGRNRANNKPFMFDSRPTVQAVSNADEYSKFAGDKSHVTVRVPYLHNTPTKLIIGNLPMPATQFHPRREHRLE